MCSTPFDKANIQWRYDNLFTYLFTVIGIMEGRWYKVYDAD